MNNFSAKLVPPVSIRFGHTADATLRPVAAHATGFVSGYFLNRLPIRPGDTHHYRDVRRLFTKLICLDFNFIILSIIVKVKRFADKYLTFLLSFY